MGPMIHEATVKNSSIAMSLSPITKPGKVNMRMNVAHLPK